MIALLLAMIEVVSIEQPAMLPSAAQVELSRFDVETAASSFVEELTKPIFAEVDLLFAKANPGKQATLAPIIARARREYRALILRVGPQMADMSIRNRARDVSGKLTPMAIRYSMTAPAKTLVAQITPDNAICLAAPEGRSECEKITRQLASVKGDGADGRAFAEVFSASRVGLMASVQMSLDSGDVRMLLKRSDIEAAGLKWPE